MRCTTCKKPIKNTPYMNIFTVDSGIERNFCADCVEMGYESLLKIENPTVDEMALMVDFRKFLKQVERRRIES